MTKRPSEMTDDERRALPTGPYQEDFRPFTVAERAAGAVGRGAVRMVLREAMAMHYRPTDIIAWRDSETGLAWSFAQFVDGQWFRSVSPY